MSQFFFRLIEPDGRLHPVSESTIGKSGMWEFYYPPQSYRYSASSRLQSLATPWGVHIDMAGYSPKTFQLKLEFGNEPKKINGKTFTPYTLREDLELFFQHYSDTNLERHLANQDLINLVFDDLLHRQHWIVVPKGLPSVSQDTTKPTRPDMTLELIGIRSFGDTPKATNPLADNLSPATPQIASRLEASPLANVGTALNL